MAKTTNKPATAPPGAKKPSPPPEKSKAVALVKPASQGLAVVDESFDGYSGGEGFEHATARDVIIPRLAILQALSPQLTKTKPEYIEGASAGMFCDTGTGDLFEDSVEIIPCFFARVYLEWHPRKSGKGLAKNHGTDASILEQCTPDDKGRMILPNGNYVAETATYYFINVSAGNRRGFVPLTSTQLKAARRWMTLLTAEKLQRADGSMFTPPIFYRSWKASVVPHSNAEGDWFGWKFEPSRTILELDPSKALLAEAKEFYQMCRDDFAKVLANTADNYDDGVVIDGRAKSSDDSSEM